MLERPARSVLALVGLLASAASAQVPLAETVVHDAPWAVEEIARDDVFVGCSLACAVGWTLSASSRLMPHGPNRYDAAQMEDQSARTAWVEGVEGNGVGETLTFRLEAGTEAARAPAIPFRGLSMVNGYAKSEATWRANGRVRSVIVRVNGAPVARADLADTMHQQSVSFAEAVPIHLGDVITIEVVSVYPGARYADTAISEIVLHGGH